METNIRIHYDFYKIPKDELLIASTQKGICFVGFVDKKKDAVADLTKRFPGFEIEQKAEPMHEIVLQYLDGTHKGKIPFHLYGTDFQLKVWEYLQKIPKGKISTYSEIANKIGHPKAVRAVGTAVGQNPVSILIPCHRVLRSDGGLGGYHWGLERKKRLLKSELQ